MKHPIFLIFCLSYSASAMNIDALIQTLQQLSNQVTVLQQSLQKRKDIIVKPPSLPNFGNTCYMNSVIQGLYSIQPLNRFLLDKDRYFDANSLAGSYITLINAFKTGSYFAQLRAFASTTDMAMQASTAQCGSGAQQDSEEFLTQLLFSLASSNNDLINNHINSMFQSILQPLYYCSPVNRTYSIAADKTNQLILPLRNPNNQQLLPNDLAEILKAFFIPEQQVAYKPEEIQLQIALENDFINVSIVDTIANTQENVLRMKRDLFSKKNLNDLLELIKQYAQKQCIKAVYLTKLPPVLIIALKRYDIDPKRAVETYQMAINVPLQLHVATSTPVIQGLDQSKIPQLVEGDYNLQAALVHLGGLTGGHYVAYVLRPDDNWYLCNDQQITQVSQEELLNGIKKGYVYIYKKTDAEEELRKEQEKITGQLNG